MRILLIMPDAHMHKLRIGSFVRSMREAPLTLTTLANTSGRGLVVGFTEDPNFRAMLDGMNVLFLNAVFRGPAHARAAGSGEE